MNVIKYFRIEFHYIKVSSKKWIISDWYFKKKNCDIEKISEIIKSFLLILKFYFKKIIKKFITTPYPKSQS